MLINLLSPETRFNQLCIFVAECVHLSPRCSMSWGAKVDRVA